MNYDDKRYIYDGQIYCDEDLSLERDDWGGDLFEFYWVLRQEGKCNETTVYYSTSHEKDYESLEELLAEEFGEYEAKENV